MSAAGQMLRVRGLSVELVRRGRRIRPVSDVELDVAPGEALAVLGESGSGKTLTALSLLGLLPAAAKPSVDGEALFEGEQLPAVGSRRWRRLRGSSIAMIFQDPLSAMNPAMTVGRQIAELYEKRGGASRRAARVQALAAMERVRIPDPERRFSLYPHQFSGGMRQRAMIAMAIALSPRLLIADEPTTALDVTVQAEILDLLRDLKQETSMAIVLITHDLAVVDAFADRVTVMYAGRTVDSGEVGILRRPAHPYSKGLRESVPRRDRSVQSRPIGGNPPDPAALPEGCAFHPRCRFARELCTVERPPLRPLDGEFVACHFAEEVRDAG